MFAASSVSTALFSLPVAASGAVSRKIRRRTDLFVHPYLHACIYEPNLFDGGSLGFRQDLHDNLQMVRDLKLNIDTYSLAYPRVNHFSRAL
ncbi:hypothetical protein MTP99_009856 [Tenebrio molitor]|nr:hypothetical protein MTP99_009856 [Tenebrio molitor]